MSNSEYKEKLWTKDFISTSVVNLALTLSMYLLLVTMAVYAMNEYDASMSMAGFVASIFVIGALAGRIYAGKQVAYTGGKKMLLIGAALVLIVTSLYFLPLGLYGLIIIRFLHGVTIGVGTTATGTIVAQVIPSSRSGEGIGYFSMSVVMATAIGPLIGVMFITNIGFTSVFLFSLVMSAVSLLLSLTLRPPQVTKPEKPENEPFSFSDYYEKRALPVSTVMFVMAFAYSSILSFVTGYAQEINLIQAGSLFFLVYGVTVLLSRPITGPLMDKKGANIVIYPAIISFALGMIVISQAYVGIVLLIAAALLGLGYGNIQSIIQALAIKMTPRENMGLANSTYFIALDLGLGLGPLVLGYLIPISGYRGMYLLLVIVILAGMLLYHFMHGRVDRKLIDS